LTRLARMRFAACAVHTGKATFYDSKGAGGNCSLPAAPADRLYVALGPSEYSSGAACGGHLDVTGPRGKVRVLIMDQCPECQPGHLDLSREAFGRTGSGPAGHVAAYRSPGDPDRERPTVRRPCRCGAGGGGPGRARRRGEPGPLRLTPATRSGGAGSAPVGPP
jgi:hypothetical protein